MNLPVSKAAAPLPVAAPARQAPVSLLMDTARFDHMVRVGKMLAMSPLFPAHLRGQSIEQGIATGVLVINMANRLNEDELTVAQNIYFVGGRPGWNTTYMIAKANMHGVFRDVIDWEIKGKNDSLEVTAFGILRSTGKRVQVTITFAMAKAEGWTKNAKYSTIPEQMLRYRSAAFLIRLYCPEVMIGLPLAVEVEMPSEKDITPDGGPVVEANSDDPINGTTGSAQDAAGRDGEAEEKAKAAAQRKADLAAEDAERKGLDLVAAESAAAAAAAERESIAAIRTKADSTAPTPDPEQWAALVEMIITDIKGGASRDEVDETYGGQIDRLPDIFPELHALILKAWAEVEK